MVRKGGNKMEETIIEIPQTDPEEGWQPPVLAHAEPDKRRKQQRYSDVFFIQYVICLLLVTGVYIIRLLDGTCFERITQLFLDLTHMPTMMWITEAFAFIQNLWN